MVGLGTVSMTIVKGVQMTTHCIRRSLAVLAPISEQARSYVRAIDSSVLSAQQGYNISEDALQLSKSVNENPAANHQEFAVSMLGLALRAQDKASVSLEQFRNVRQALLKVCFSWTVNLGALN